MIREFTRNDTAAVMQVWLETIVEAHDFVNKDYWLSVMDNMKNNYILNSQNYVYTKDGGVVGFLSIIEENTIAAMFVDVEFQGKGIGSELINHIKRKYDILNISVFKKNIKAQNFLEKNNFKYEYEQHDVNTGETELLYTWEKRKNEL